MHCKRRPQSCASSAQDLRTVSERIRMDVVVREIDVKLVIVVQLVAVLIYKVVQHA